MNDLAWLMATCKDTKTRIGQEPVRLARMACDATRYREVNYLDILAAANAEIGNFPEAVRIGRLAIDIAVSLNPDNSLMEAYRQERYSRHLPYTE